jgi:peroxin-13
MAGGAPNQFVELAQEGAQPAFQSIESVVQAVSSVSLMLESTYTAVRASFQAVLGVAEQFSNMKLQISQVWFQFDYRIVLFLSSNKTHAKIFYSSKITITKYFYVS